MIIETKYFGLHTYSEEEIITFKEGLFGFENENQFLLLPFDKEDDSMMSLQCINHPDIAFVLFKPSVIDETYFPALTKEQKKAINLKNINDLKYYAIAIVYDDFKDTVANLKCPLAFNTRDNLGMQIILDTKEYTFRHPVFKEAGGV